MEETLCNLNRQKKEKGEMQDFKILIRDCSLRMEIKKLTLKGLFFFLLLFTNST